MKAEAIGKPGICYSDYLSIAEIRSKYPDVPIFELGEGYQYKEIENDCSNWTSQLCKVFL